VDVDVNVDVDDALTTSFTSTFLDPDAPMTIKFLRRRLVITDTPDGAAPGAGVRRTQVGGPGTVRRSVSSFR
jgi:hypothetical protein